MKNKTITLILTAILLLAMLLVGCGGRDVGVDTDAFYQPESTFSESTDDEPGGYDPLLGDQGQAQDLAQMLASGAAVQYERVSCYDQSLGCEAVRSVAPAGWQSGGQVYWNIQSGAAPATVDFFIAAPDGSARVGYVSPLSFVVPDPQYQLTDGQWYSPTVCPVKNYQDAQSYAQAYFQEYTGISNTQLVDTELPEGEAAQAIQEYVSVLQQMSDELTAQFAQSYEQANASMETYCSADAATVTLGFDMNGAVYKAKAFVMISATEMINTQDIPYVGQWSDRQLNWNTGPVGFRYYIAEESRFGEYEAEAELFFQNLISNQQWSDAVQQVSDKLFQDQIQSTFEQVMAQQEALRQFGQQAVAQSAQNYSSAYSSSDYGYSSAVMDGWTNAVTDQEYFQTSDGGYAQLDSSYMHTYSDGTSFVQSNDSLDMPSGWDEVSGSTMIPGGG